MNNLNSKKVKIGQEFTVKFVKNEKDSKKAPVCRIGKKICFIDKINKEHIEVGSSWIVRVEKVSDRFLIVKPLVIWKTKEQIKELEEANYKRKVLKLKNEGIKGTSNSNQRRRRVRFENKTVSYPTSFKSVKN